MIYTLQVAVKRRDAGFRCSDSRLQTRSGAPPGEVRRSARLECRIPTYRTTTRFSTVMRMPLCGVSGPTRRPSRRTTASPGVAKRRTTV